MAPFALPERIFTRPISARYAECLRADTAPSIDLPLARSQYAGYVAALLAAGLIVEEILGDDGSPDACFVEDTAVLTGAHALATRPGAESRRAEVEPVARALARHREIHRMEAPATLDGGDVLRIDGRLFVGTSQRTNREGVEALARVAARDGLQVVPVPVRAGLHLKSSCTLASEALVLYDPSAMGDAELTPLRVPGIELLAAPEPAGANVLALGTMVFVSSAAPRTADILRARGLDVRTIEAWEIHKGDGSLTCLSLRVPRRGSWCT